jgi:ribosomal protein S18
MKKSALVVLVFSVVLLFYSEPAMAHNCSGLQDCYQQSKLAALAAALIALLLSLLLDFSPIGYWKGLLEAITGRDILTGDKLAWWQRALNLVPGGKGARTAAKAVDDVSDIAKAVNKVSDAAKVGEELGDTAKAAGKVSDAAKTVDKASDVTSKFEPKIEKQLDKRGWTNKAESEATKAVNKADEVANVNDPYNVAKQGGKHSGFYDEYSKRPDSQIQKGIESINKQISEHQNKIEDPQKFISDFDKLDPRQQKALPDKWQRDINRQIEQKTILEGILKERRL